jgi:3-deoxy-7-phosphoheptulonate synthase
MTDKRIEDLNIVSCSRLVRPETLKESLPMSEAASKSVLNGRKTIKNILERKDKRLFVLIGPCSIHDPAAAIDYGHRLKALADQVQDTLCLAMRVYFEKPRSTIGWKGLINDPHMNGSFDIEEGLHIGRRLLLELAEMGLPLATEALDPISPQYMQDLISWSAIGARTTESQTHREMSSGLSCTVGFKNGTDGSLAVAVNALKSVSHPHNFLGIDAGGHVAIISTAGNKYGHVVLRGGNGKPNYDSVNIATCEQTLEKAGVCPYIVVDCSHENSYKNPDLQPLVAENVTNQILEGNQSIIGLMIESNINSGNQSIPENPDDLQYGVSVTDGCLGWEATEKCITDMHEKLLTLR